MMIVSSKKFINEEGVISPRLMKKKKMYLIGEETYEF